MSKHRGQTGGKPDRSSGQPRAGRQEV